MNSAIAPRNCSGLVYPSRFSRAFSVSCNCSSTSSLTGLTGRARNQEQFLLTLEKDCPIKGIMRIVALRNHRSRNPRGYFQDLPALIQRRAYHWLGKFCKRWGSNLPPWRLALLVGQARRLALNPPTSAWGRSMLAKRGGLAVQRKYRLEGKHPTAYATRCRVLKQNAKQRAAAEAKLQASMGLPPPSRVAFLPLD